MARAQNSRKGLHQFASLTAGTAVMTTATITTASITTGSVTTLTPTTLDLSGVMSLTGNSTGIVFGDYEAALPGDVDNGILVGVISNSTGVAMFINSTGTTHKYLLTTTKQPT